MKKHLVVLATSIAGLLILIQFIHPAGTQALAVRTSPASFKPAAPSPVVANDGDLDPTFKATVIEDTDSISTVITQPDGKIIVGGFFESVGGCLNRTVARLNADGSCDPSFEPDPAVPGPFNGQTTAAALALQSDGKILVGFRFFAPGSIVRKLVVRLNTDGSLDSSFNANVFNAAFQQAAVHDILVQPDGRIIVGGIFNYNFNGAKRSLARLNADGSFDASFVPSFNGPMGQRTIFALGLQTDGRIIIGGQFTMFNTVGGEPRDAVARLNADGSLDTTFGRLNPDGSITSDLSGSAVSLVIQPNGQVIAAGGLTSNQDGSGLIMRLGTDGRRDPSFANIFLSGAPRTLALQPDGRVVAGGDFQITAPATRNNIARLNSDGTLDTSFDTGTGMTGTMRVVEGVALQANGQVAVGGGFDNFNGAFAEDILLLNSDGSRDATFESNGAGRSARVNALLRQPDCKLLVGFGGIAGFSTKLNGARMNGIGRLNPDSSVDTSFASPLTTAAIVFAMALQSDGKVIIGGNLNISPTSFKLLRLNADGSLDPTFNPPTDLNPRAIVIQPDGKIIAAGNYVARLNPDGSLDNTFARADFFGAGFPTATSLALQPDGRVVIAGIFAGVNITSRNNIARLNSDGSVDTSFNPGAGPNSTVDRLVLQPDGRIIIGGNFFNYDSTARDRLARINADGSLDTSFVPVNPSSKRIGALLLQSDGKLLVGSLYDGSSKTPPSRVFRLNADGTLDLTFNLGTGLEEDFIAGGDVNAFSMQADGNLVIGGRFDIANDQPRLCLARLFNSTGSPPSSQSTFQFSAAAYTVSENGGTAIITVTRAGGSACDPVLTVDYATSDGTATGGINAPPILFDYAPASGTLTFQPGEISMTFNVTIYDDTSDETDETVNLMLSNPTGGATLGPQSAAVLTILDDDNAPAPGMTSVSLTSSSNPSVTGSPVTFTATVSVVPPATGTPTGTVEFFDGAVSLGSAALVGGSAQLSTSTLTAGSHTITAVYGGAAGFTGSTSSPLVQVVGLATPVGLNVPITLPVGNTTVRVVFAEVIEAGVTTAYAIDRCQLPLPSSIFVDANSRAFEINTTARFLPTPPPILPGQPNPPPIAPVVNPQPPPIRLSFEMPFVTNQTAFNSLRVVHYFTPQPPPIVPPNPVVPQDGIVPPNPICPAGGPSPPPIIPQIQLATRDFATRTITANLTSLSPFLIAPSSDTTAPATSALFAAPNAAGWHNSDVMVTLNSTDNADGAGVYAITYSATGAQPIPETTVTGSSASFTINTEGITDITFYATDLAANIEAAQTLTIRLDKTLPAVVCPANTIINAGVNCQAAIPDLRAGVTASDNLTPAASLIITQNPAPGAMAGTGVFMINLTATDEAGNSATCASTLTVNDTSPPSISCPANLAATAPAGSNSTVVNYATPQASDNCPGATVACAPPSGSSFPLGMTTVLCAATDTSNNSGQCSFTVEVTSAPPPSTDRIVFESTRDGNLEIYVMKADGTDQTRLTFNQHADANPAWSPDRTKIVFTSLRDGNLDIYVMNSDGTGQTRLTTNSALDDGPAWSPDGTKIAFWSLRNGNAEIYVMNSDGTGQTRLTNHSRADTQPEWSPDGMKIAFTSNRASLLNLDIHVMNANGSGVTRLTSHSAVDESPAWSADGTKIAFTSNRTGLLDFEVWVMNSNGTSPVRLTSSANTSARPSWSRDGMKIAFTTNRDGLVNFEIYTMDANGSNQTRLTTNEAIDFTPHW